MPALRALTTDGLAFSEQYSIRGYEVNPDQRANIVTMANLLQVMGVWWPWGWMNTISSLHPDPGLSAALAWCETHGAQWGFETQLKGWLLVISI